MDPKGSLPCSEDPDNPVHILPTLKIHSNMRVYPKVSGLSHNEIN